MLHTESSFTSTTTVSHSHSSASLSIHISSASELVSAQTIGKQDPYVQFSLDFNQKDTYLKTFTHKNAGQNATWNQTFNISLNGEPDLFIEVLDEESTVDEVIGFAAIPINQVVHAPGAHMNGLFTLYDTKGEKAGVINLQLAASGFPNSETPNFNCEPVYGKSYVHEGHCQRMKSNKKKATGVAVGGALLGGALAIGAGFLGKKLYDDYQEQEQEEQHQEEEQQRLREEEEQKRRQEREEFEREKADFERRRNEEEHQYERRDEDEERSHHHRRRNSCSDDDEGAEKWNPVGTYAAGDRVKYHGQVYVCLQGHTSNPTWQPGVAHSLWQAE
ncbi:C2 domain-containing protein [Gilbertella persicaria]|uniref:C2 domain-containing protein n=1 Tax=Gilbertella persicaria TaxID=101096 RepID=UPI00221FA193|nr:C2 domain-containing protein [Gilbertella persicaria]KAI8076449.1 C2 domain-containing protein [Gilbertella persicaria]